VPVLSFNLIDQRLTHRIDEPARADVATASKVAYSRADERSATLAGDFDHDGDVDGRDFLLWQRGGSPIPKSASDLADWQANYGTGTLVADIQASPITAVPEPASLSLILALTTAALCGRPIKE
jgi:hypothetical protein